MEFSTELTDAVATLFKQAIEVHPRKWTLN